MTSYTAFFSGTATVAGALIGLLFVALSVTQERLRGRTSLEHQAIASTAFTALLDALFVSLIGLQPGGGLDYGAVILGGIGLTSSCGLGVRMWRARRTDAELSRRWPFLLGFIILVYAAQVISGFLVRSESSEADLTVAFVYIMFATGIGRSWELIGLEGGGPLDLLARGLGAHRPLAHPDHAADPEPPEPPAGAP